jgi:hypothetical protein
MEKVRGWRVTHRANTRFRGSGGEGGGAGGAGKSSVSDRIELGVLLGAGSFGRVYKGRWHGERRGLREMTAARPRGRRAL